MDYSAMHWWLVCSLLLLGSAPGQGADARTVTWKEITSPEYTNYLTALRAAGCPETHVRHIVVSDVQEFFAQRRLREALQWDFAWWKPVPLMRLYPPGIQASDTRNENQRAAFFSRFLGTNWAEVIKVPRYVSGLPFHLTGPVLGAMPADRLGVAVDICQRSEERLRDYQLTRFAQGEPMNLTEEARMRDQTRTELRRVMTPEEFEEYLVRNSQNAELLRQVLVPFDPTREEFLTIFRVFDPLQHRMQLEYGNEGALSARQRDEFERQCHRAVQEVLPPERFKAYLTAADPCYKQAQTTAQKRGLDENAVTSLYEFYRAQAAKREKVQQDRSLSLDMKNQALQELVQEEDKFVVSLTQKKGPGP